MFRILAVFHDIGHLHGSQLVQAVHVAVVDLIDGLNRIRIVGGIVGILAAVPIADAAHGVLINSVNVGHQGVLVPVEGGHIVDRLAVLAANGPGPPAGAVLVNSSLIGAVLILIAVKLIRSVHALVKDVAVLVMSDVSAVVGHFLRRPYQSLRLRGVGAVVHDDLEILLQC